MTFNDVDMASNKLACERGHGTEHLPTELRDCIYHAAYCAGHQDGYGEVTNYYGDFAEVALAAYEAASAERDALRAALEDALRIGQTVNHYEGVIAACKRVGLTLRHDECLWSK
jgi:hypothetical protein